MLWLGIDYGKARTGLATGDDDTRLAFPLSVLPTPAGLPELADAIAAVAKREMVGGLVLGQPRRLTGESALGTIECEAAQLATLLAERTGLPVESVDERFTTAYAERLKRDAGGAVKIGADALAAAAILETFLETRANRRN